MALICRWEAGQILARNLMLTQVVNFQKGNALVLDPQFVHGIKCIILDSSLDKVLYSGTFNPFLAFVLV